MNVEKKLIVVIPQLGVKTHMEVLPVSHVKLIEHLKLMKQTEMHFPHFLNILNTSSFELVLDLVIEDFKNMNFQSKQPDVLLI